MRPEHRGKLVRSGALGTLVLSSLVALVIVPAAAVFACTGTPYLTLSPNAGAPGTVVTVTGYAFGNGATSVTARWDGSNGPVLWTGPVDASHGFRFTFAVPAAASGFDYVNAYSEGGAASSSSPVHSGFQVTAPGGGSPPPPSPYQSAGASGQTSGATQQASNGTAQANPAPGNPGSGAGSQPTAAQTTVAGGQVSNSADGIAKTHAEREIYGESATAISIRPAAVGGSAKFTGLAGGRHETTWLTWLLIGAGAAVAGGCVAYLGLTVRVRRRPHPDVPVGIEPAPTESDDDLLAA